MKIFSYVIPRDYGFAPNPFYGYCTLGTCKPDIRKAANVGDIIIGTRGSPKTKELVYFMEVEEILTFDQYWTDSRFAEKKPDLYKSKKKAFGDNIYHRTNTGKWLQEDSHHTNEDGSTCQENIDTDTKSDRVLISRNFAYWGGNSIEIPPTLRTLIKKGIGQKNKFDNAFKITVRDWLFSHERGYLGNPGAWK